jgi:hypothetical protein
LQKAEAFSIFHPSHDEAGVAKLVDAADSPPWRICRRQKNPSRDCSEKKECRSGEIGRRSRLSASADLPKAEKSFAGLSEKKECRSGEIGRRSRLSASADLPKAEKSFAGLSEKKRMPEWRNW